MSDSFSLHIDSVVVRDWEEADLTVWQHWLSPGHRWKDLDGPYYPPPTTSEIDQMITGTRQRIAAHDWPMPHRRAVIATRDPNRLIGIVTWYWESEETLWPGIGIVIYDPAFWGQGIGYRALGLWCDYLWRSLPTIVRLDLRTWSGNLGMMRLAQKLGFREEARFRRARIVAGVYYDGLGYGLLREEWEQRFPLGYVAALTGR